MSAKIIKIGQYLTKLLPAAVRDVFETQCRNAPFFYMQFFEPAIGLINNLITYEKNIEGLSLRRISKTTTCRALCFAVH